MPPRQKIFLKNIKTKAGIVQSKNKIMTMFFFYQKFQNGEAEKMDLRFYTESNEKILSMRYALHAILSNTFFVKF